MPLRVRRDHVPYDVWERQGYLKTTEGNVVHYGFIENFIDELGQKFHIKEIAFDRWGAVQMSQNLLEEIPKQKHIRHSIRPLAWIRLWLRVTLQRRLLAKRTLSDN